MKLFILILLFPIAGIGQIDISYKKYDTLPQQVIDTARVMIVYADTTSTTMFSEKLYSHLCVWQFGYEVVSKQYRGIYYVPVGNGTEPQKWYNTTHIAYLDEKKNLLPKSIVVIQTIKL